MSSAAGPRPSRMTTTTQTTVTNLGVAMFVVADQDAALTFYTETLGWELRSDSRFGPEESMRWLEVAPPGSTARLALNPPMGGAQPGGTSIGVETAELAAEHARLLAVDGLDVDGEIMGGQDMPRMFMVRDPDGNTVVVVEPQPAD